MFDSKTRILVVDDVMAMRMLVSKTCKELGFSDIICASDGEQGWQMIAGACPPVGLVISDLNMPLSNGLDLLKRIRGDHRFNALPFMIATNGSEQERFFEAIHAGADNCVIKPFSADVLKEKLLELYRKR